jgi:hypothetical protein
MRRISSRGWATLSLLFASGAVMALAVLTDGCSSDSAGSGSSGSTTDASSKGDDGGGSPEDAPSTTDATPGDGSTDATADAPSSIACTGGKPVADAGETCTGFGQKDPCDKCTPGGYGYVCFGGGPPNIAGCQLVRSSSFGETYCCPKNDCVAEPDQDSKCRGKAGTPHRYQCPPTNDDGGFATPPAGCVNASTPADPYPYYCCP